MPDKRAFEKFYHQHLDKVYRFVFFRCSGNKEQAEDLVSEIFMKALENFETYDATRSTSAWIMTITRNHLINHWRDTKRTNPLPEDQDDSEENNQNSDAFWFNSAMKAWRKTSDQAETYELLAKLEPSEGEFVTLHYLIGYSYAEIAKQKQMSEGAVKVAAHRAIKKLRRNM